MESQPLVNLKVSQPDQALFKSASNALSMAKRYRIDSADMRDLAARELTKIKALQKKVDEQRKAITQPIDVAKRAVMTHFAPPTEYLDEAETLLKRAIQSFDREQEQKRIAEQAKLDEAARVERARLVAEAAAREAATQDEARKLREAAEAAASAGKHEEAARLAADAESRIDQGAAEVATLQQTSTLITAPVTEAPRKAAGVSSRKVWKAEVTDKLELIKFVASHPEYVDVLDASMPALNKLAVALKANCPLKGVRVFEDSVLAARAA